MTISAIRRDALAEQPCAVTNCPAFAIRGERTCAIHKVARLADNNSRCPRCQRAIRKATKTTDASWVVTWPVTVRGKKGHSHTEYRPAHAHCPPIMKRARKRDEPKELIDAIGAAE